MSDSKKAVVLGVCGGIAAYKACELVRLFVKAGLDVHVIMTQSATEFVTPLTFRSLSGNPTVVGMFDEPEQWDIKHVSLAKRADVFVVAPATANFIAKAANGIADDMLTTTFLACARPKIIAPAMNTGMWENPLVQENVSKLRRLGYDVMDTDTGSLACRDVGSGRMPSPDRIFAHAMRAMSSDPDLKGLRCLVTAGPTREALDPVRFISNRSSGKMGYAIAAELWTRGAQVVLVTGPGSATPPYGPSVVKVESTVQMLEACDEFFGVVDVAVFSAAPSDYRPAVYRENKIKKTGGSEPVIIDLVENPDVAKAFGAVKHKGQISIVFAAETENLLTNAVQKLKAKNADMMVANDVTRPGAGFEVDTNAVTFLYPDRPAESLDVMAKTDIAAAIVDRIASLRRSLAAEGGKQ